MMRQLTRGLKQSQRIRLADMLERVTSRPGYVRPMVPPSLAGSDRKDRLEDWLIRVGVGAEDAALISGHLDPKVTTVDLVPRENGGFALTVR